MSPEQWQEIKQLFSAIVDSCPENDWMSELEKRAENDSTLYKEVEALLKFHGTEGDFLETPPPILAELANEALATPIQVGERYDDFEILQKIGEGSFGVVYLANQVSLGRRVALKVTPDLGHEAETLATLEHDSIVPVYTVARLKERGLRLISMKWVRGPNLHEVLQRLPAEWSGNTFLSALGGAAEFDPKALADLEKIRGFDGIQTIFWICSRLGEALAHAHQRGILHLDIKPANILVTPYGRPLLTDFNISQQSEEIGMLRGGTKHYMPPEQEAVLEGSSQAPPTEKADVFAMGVLLKELLGSHSRATEIGHTIVDACLNENPALRPTAKELVRRLRCEEEIYEMNKALPPLGKFWSYFERHPLLALTMACLVPQIFGSIINIAYNSTQIVSSLSLAQQDFFHFLIPVYNAFTYPGAVALLFYRLVPLVRFLQAPHSICAMSTKDCARLRTRFLRFPFRLSVLVTLGWLPGAIFFPLAIDHWRGPISSGIYLHFAISFVLSWLVALAYSYIGSQFVVIRLFYARLWNSETALSEYAPRELKAIRPVFHYTAGVIPLLATALILFSSKADLDESRFLLLGLISLGTLGLFFGFQNHTVLQRVRATFLSLGKRL